MFSKKVLIFLVLVYTPETFLILDTKPLQGNLIIKRNIPVLSFENLQPETKAGCARRWPSAEGNVCCTGAQMKDLRNNYQSCIMVGTVIALAFGSTVVGMVTSLGALALEKPHEPLLHHRLTGRSCPRASITRAIVRFSWSSSKFFPHLLQEVGHACARVHRLCVSHLL